MLSLRIIKLLLILINVAYSQSIYNSHGMGIMKSSFHSSSDGLGSIGLVPSFTAKVSLDNPSTWRHLNYSYINSSYISEAFELKNSTIASDVPPVPVLGPS